MTNRTPLDSVDQRHLRDGDRVTLLINPAARSTGDQASIASVRHTLEQRYRVDLIAPRQGSEFDIAVTDAASSADAVIVAGGDGTLHRVINALNGLKAAIGLLPLGTGNDFARALNIPVDPAGAASRILDGRIRQIDLVSVNNRLFCTVGVVGLPAEATLAFDRLWRPGSWTRPLMRALGGWSYRLAGLNALLSRGSRVEHMRLECADLGDTSDADITTHTGITNRADITTHAGGENPPTHPTQDTVSGNVGGSESREVFGAFVTNTTLLGGGMNVPVDSDMADGQLEIACIEAMPRMRLYWAFLCLANGWRVPDGVLRVLRTDRAVISCKHRLPFAADGELVCESDRFEVAVLPGALRVIC